MNSPPPTPNAFHLTNTLRTVAIPTDHLIAEMTAFPLASEAAFRLGLTDIHADLQGASRNLWRAAENELLRASPGMSLDEIVAVRDRIWYKHADSQQSLPLHQYLRRVACENLETRGAMASPAVLEAIIGDGADHVATDARSRQAWRWLSFAMPPDLILAGLWNHATSPTGVQLLAPQVSRRLRDHGFAEMHLHIGAALDFPLLWIAALNHLASPELTGDDFRSPGAAFNEGRELASWLLRVALTRYLLAAFLRYRANTPSAVNNLREYLQRIARPILLPSMHSSGLAALDIMLRELAQGQFSSGGPTLDDLRNLYTIITQVRAIPFPTQKDLMPNADPIAGLWPPGARFGGSSEMIFTAQSLAYLDACSPPLGLPSDREFAVLFWQATRVRALYYRHIVQRPMTPGLQWFIRTFGRIGPGRRPLAFRPLVESAVDVSGLEHGLRSLEMRTSPGPQASDMLTMFEEANDVLDELTTTQGVPLEFGVVLHLTKFRGGGFEAGHPRPNWAQSHADPRAAVNTKSYRYAYFFEQKRQETLALARLLMDFPQSLRILRGIDMCTDEIGVPTWVLTPLFRYLHDAGRIASSYLTKTLGFEIPPLHSTVHTGEDFVHLLGGLRSVADAIRYLKLREGDRIGHGVALGVDARAWAQRTGRIAVSLEQRLFDLTWEWTCYSREGVRFDSSRLAYIEDAIERLARTIFGEDWSCRPSDIADLYDDLHNERLLGQTGFPNGDPPDNLSPRDRRWRLTAYLTRPDVFRRGQQTDWVFPDQEADILENLQTYLRQRVASLGLAIEINPSSNLLIANLGDLRHHPLWRLRPPEQHSHAPRLRVCIGSDDPIIFSTGLPDEYMLLHDVLVLAGLNADDADLWIDRARQTGLDSRFTLPRRGAIHLRSHAASGLDRAVPPIFYGHHQA